MFLPSGGLLIIAFKLFVELEKDSTSYPINASALRASQVHDK